MTTDTPRTGVGPGITTNRSAAEPLVEAFYLDAELRTLRPWYGIDWNDNVRTLPHLPLPRVTEITPTLPEVVDLMYEIPRVEPALYFEDFIRGVACVAALVPAAYHDAVKGALLFVAENIEDTAGAGRLPSLDPLFASNINACEHAIFINGETVSHRPLLAFTQGAFWLLGYMHDPTTPTAPHAPSLLDFVSAMVLHYAALGYVPHG